MLAKVVYMCAIMVAVQSRAVLYGTSILDLIMPSNETDEAQLGKNSSSEVSEEVDDWNYSIYDIGRKFLNSISSNVQLMNSMNEESSPNKVSSTQSPPNFSVVTHGFDDLVTENEDSHTGSINSVHILLPGNDSVTNSGLLGVTKWHFSKDVIHRAMPGLEAFGYQN